MSGRKITAKDLILCALFTALIIVGAFIRIPIPVLPITLQLSFTILAGLLLGARLGALSVLAYIILGLVGLPIFASGGGLAYIFRPSFGYIIGFLVSSFIAGAIANKVPEPSFKRLLGASFTGLAIIYVIGMIYFYLISNYVINSPIDLRSLIIYCFAVTVPGDIILCVLGCVLARRLIPVIRKFSVKS